MIDRPWFFPLMIAAALSGWLLASAMPDVLWLNETTRLVMRAFLAALKMIIAPLIFFSLVTGVLNLRRTGHMGRLGWVTLAYYAGTSAIAIIIGLSVVFFVHPWTDYPPIEHLPDVEFTLIDTESGSLLAMLSDLLLKTLENPFAALANTNILGILVAALLFGTAAAVVLPEQSIVPEMLEQVTQITYRVARWIISTLPLGLFAIAHQMSHQIDGTTLLSLAGFAGVVVGATLLHGLVVLPTLAYLLTGTSPLRFFNAAAKPLLTAFVTSSSAATLPVSLNAARTKFGVDRDKASFVLPLGATINMDGTALFEGIAVIFLAYMFGIELTAASIVVVFFVAMLASAGAPGIPSGSMAGLQVVLLAVGIPLEAIALILLIERPLDTIRTAVNVQGDLIGALVAQRFAGAAKT